MLLAAAAEDRRHMPRHSWRAAQAQGRQQSAAAAACLIAVGGRLVGTVQGHVDVGALVRCQAGQLDAQLGQVEGRHLESRQGTSQPTTDRGQSEKHW